MKTLKALIAQLGIDEAHEVRLINRRARYAMSRDRTKVWPTTRLDDVPSIRYAGYGAWRASVHDINADLQQLRIASSLGMTRDYVAAWCRLNHLKEC